MTARQNRHISIAPLVVSLALLALLAVFIRYHLDTIQPLPSTAPISVFSAGRAFEALQKLNPGEAAHPVDSAADRAIAERLVDALDAMGYRPEIQQTPVCGSVARGLKRCTNISNVIATIEGREPGHGILLSAHYDSVPAGPGASDDGMGVATLLEVARLMQREPQPRNTIVMLFNEGEEFGL
ncbi:MAG: M20/M25/M40 family metallo-hydrolase, partial [Lysobacterales bacterium]